MSSGGGDLYGALVSGATGYLSAIKSAKEARAASKRQYRYWKRGLVEGPGLQMKGLRDAGLNPILAAGGLTGANANISAPMGDMSSIAQSGRNMARHGPEMRAMKAATQQAESARDLSQAQSRTEVFRQELLREQGDQALADSFYKTQLGEQQRLINESTGVMRHNFYRTPEGRALWMMNEAMPSGGNVVSSTAKGAAGIAAAIGRFLRGGKSLRKGK